MIGMVRYCASELCAARVYRQPHEVRQGEDDYNAQKLFVDRLCAAAKDLDAHIHLVHHLKKPSKEGDRLDKHDAKGSGSITDQSGQRVHGLAQQAYKEEDMRVNGDRSGAN